METNSESRRYETRRSARAKEPVAKSQIDWQQTKIRSILTDSEEESDEITPASEKETSSDDDTDEREKGEPIHNEDKDETLVDTGGLPDVETSSNCAAGEDVDESIYIGKRRRSRTAVMYDSDDSDGSDIVRKKFAKRSCIIDEEDLCTEHTSPAEKEAKRKQDRLMKLRELSQRRSTRASSISEYQEDSEEDVIIEDDSCHSSFKSAEISDASEVDSMKDFIEEEEEEEESEQENSEEDKSQSQKKKKAVSGTFLQRFFPSLVRVDHFVHFQRVVKAFLINAVDNDFLMSLYEGRRQKKYAKEMLTSLNYFDNDFVQPRLDNLVARSRWKERYKERVNSYPVVHIVSGEAEQRSCEACELQRYCKFTVFLSGNLYNRKTMQIDDFMSHDEQELKVGTVCSNRTEVYHNLKHFKYKLFQNCCSIMASNEFQDVPIKDTVDRIFTQQCDEGWIEEQYSKLQSYMESAENFQDEKID